MLFSKIFKYYWKRICGAAIAGFCKSAQNITNILQNSYSLKCHNIVSKCHNIMLFSKNQSSASVNLCKISQIFFSVLCSKCLFVAESAANKHLHFCHFATDWPHKENIAAAFWNIHWNDLSKYFPCGTFNWFEPLDALDKLLQRFVILEMLVKKPQSW